MIKKHFLVLIISAFCLAACSKKEEVEVVSAEVPSPSEAVVTEAPAQASQDQLRDPMNFIIPNSAVLAKQNAVSADKYEVEKIVERLIAGNSNSLEEQKKAVEEIKKLKTVKDAKFSGSDLWVKYEGGELHSFALSLSPDLTNDTSAQAEPDHLNY